MRLPSYSQSRFRQVTVTHEAWGPLDFEKSTHLSLCYILLLKTTFCGPKYKETEAELLWVSREAQNALARQK